jgi:hypothetical protein
MATKEPLLTLSQASRACGVSRSTLHYAVERGDLKCKRLAESLPPLVTIVDVQHWIATGVHTTGPKPKQKRKRKQKDVVITEE